MRPASWTAKRYLPATASTDWRVVTNGSAIPGTLNCPISSGWRPDEGFDVSGRGGLADGRGDIEGIEIAGLDEAVDRAQIDVIGIHMVGMLPGKFPDGGIGGGFTLAGSETDDQVLAIRLIPDGDHGDTGLGGRPGGHDASCQLRLGLMREAVSHSNRELL